MNRDFDVDDNGLTADGYKVLDPMSKKVMYIANAMLIAIATIIMGLVVYYSEVIFSDYSALGSTIVLAIWAVLVIYSAVEPSITYSRYRYRMDDDKVEVRRGVITIVHYLVPIERVHQVNVSRGPINRHYGLADVTVTTAGGTVTLQHLTEEEAESIATKLNETVVEILKQRA